MSNQAIIILFFVFSSLLSAHETFAQDFQRAPSRMENNIDRFGVFNGSTWDNYHNYQTHDMNGDGHIDRVQCQGGSSGYYVKIINLKNNKTIDLRKPSRSFNHGSLTGFRLVTGCSIVEIKKGHPSVVVSGFKQMSNGRRWAVDHFVHYNKGSGPIANRFVLRHLNVGSANGGAIRMVGRDVRCTRYPEALEARFGEGALCFFSAYHEDAVLAKIEPNGNHILTLDITPNSGLIWNMGNLADSGSHYSYYNYDRCQRSYWGSYNTIGGTWLDYNKDGKPDLVTTGQHAPTWPNTMRFDTNSTAIEAIKFSRAMIHNNPNSDVPTEFIRITALNEIRIRAHNGGKVVHNRRTNQPLADLQKIKCMQPGSMALGFELTVPKSKLSSSNKRLKISARDRVTGRSKTLKTVEYNYSQV
jgi:hypothetical protein